MHGDKLLEQFKSNIEGLNIDILKYTITVFHSGGKDSSILLDFIVRSGLFNLQNVTAVMVEYPLAIYSPRDDIDIIKEYWVKRNITIHSYGVGPEKNLPEINNNLQYEEIYRISYTSLKLLLGFSTAIQ